MQVAPAGHPTRLSRAIPGATHPTNNPARLPAYYEVNRSFLMASVNVLQDAAVNLRTGPSGVFESLTSTAPFPSRAASTHDPDSHRELRRHSGSDKDVTCELLTLVPTQLSRPPMPDRQIVFSAGNPPCRTAISGTAVADVKNGSKSDEFVVITSAPRAPSVLNMAHA
ncbi:hypothetical protein GCM10009557_20210 [Virgisporangium ochraceum]|uniref:Uncharacterized protein n=1 Tax=Virgisporangium ochraceum TaxID=65505 RepID=A0A8J3ZP56_9ACTN|nr:hypothetical protein Voc01_005720 [Virgisporangium ochraceum]